MNEYRTTHNNELLCYLPLVSRCHQKMFKPIGVQVHRVLLMVYSLQSNMAECVPPACTHTSHEYVEEHNFYHHIHNKTAKHISPRLLHPIHPDPPSQYLLSIGASIILYIPLDTLLAIHPSRSLPQLHLIETQNTIQ